MANAREGCDVGDYAFEFGYILDVAGTVEVVNCVGESVEVVGALEGGVGSEDGGTAGGKVEGDGATNAFCCAAVGRLEVNLAC